MTTSQQAYEILGKTFSAFTGGIAAGVIFGITMSNALGLHTKITDHNNNKKQEITILYNKIANEKKNIEGIYLERDGKYIPLMKMTPQTIDSVIAVYKQK